MTKPAQGPAVTALAGLQHQVDILLRRYPGAKPGNPTPAQIGDFMMRLRELGCYRMDCLLREGTPPKDAMDATMRDLDCIFVQVEPYIQGVRQSIRQSLAAHLAHVGQPRKTTAAAAGQSKARVREPSKGEWLELKTAMRRRSWPQLEGEVAAAGAKLPGAAGREYSDGTVKKVRLEGWDRCRDRGTSERGLEIILKGFWKLYNEHCGVQKPGRKTG